MTAEKMAVNNTAAAATSFAFPASSWYSGCTRSTTYSIAVLRASAAQDHGRAQQDHNPFPQGKVQEPADAHHANEGYQVNPGGCLITQ
jgi:hypothetical protein